MLRSSALVQLAAVTLAFGSLTACAEDTPPPQPPPQPPVAPAPPPLPPAAAGETPPPAPPTPPKPTMAELEGNAINALSLALNRHDPQAYAMAFAPDAVRRGTPDAVGREAIAKVIGEVFAREPDLKYAPGRAYLAGNVAVVEWVTTGTDSGTGFLGHKASGRPVGQNGAAVLWFTDDGLVKEQHVYADLGTTLSQTDPKAKAGSFRPPPEMPTMMQMTPAMGTPDEDTLRASGKAYYASFDSHNVAELMAPVTDDSVYIDYTTPGELKGKKAFQGMIAMLLKALPDIHQPIAHQWVVQDTLITEGTTEGTLKGALGPIRPTGKPIAYHFLDVVQFRNGKLVRGETYSNAVELLTQTGALKLPKSKP